MNRFQGFFCKVFRCCEEDNNVNAPETKIPGYVWKNEELAKKHLEYLYKINDDEDSRLATIENKLGLLIGQSGIVFAIITFLLPLFFDKLLFLDGYIYLFIIPVGLGFYFLVRSLLLATKTLNVKMFIYQRGSTNSVFKKSILNEKQFIRMEVEDLVSIIQFNTDVNNTKASVLFKAHKNFVYGIVINAILTFIISIIIMSHSPEPSTILVNVTKSSSDSSLHIIDKNLSGINRNLIDIDSAIHINNSKSNGFQDSIFTTLKSIKRSMKAFHKK